MPWILSPQGHTHTEEHYPRKADEDTSTQHQLHKQPRSKPPCHILPSQHTACHDGKERPLATPSQPQPTSATEQTPLSTVLTTDPLTLHQDGTNSPDKRSPAGGPHHAPASKQTHHIAATATTRNKRPPA
ncbi:hypothetical protein ATANTOWER_030705 [Ataeniobius toweri]|uniref:Uncharacterized protein n=1 Tax=Ataeniobius toweri TaxID=208326 RepID=A0ABU7BTT2_9TELE|nr:hypothetical protein [Ataeniobius toweri]